MAESMKMIAFCNTVPYRIIVMMMAAVRICETLVTSYKTAWLSSRDVKMVVTCE